MSFFNFGKKKRYTMIRRPHGLDEMIDFHFKMKAGEIVISCHTMPKLKSVIVLPSYNPYLRKDAEIGYGVKDFIDDILEIIDIIDLEDMGEDAFFNAFDVFTRKHINLYNRLIDTDLFRIVAELTSMMQAVANKNNIEFTSHDRIDITNVFIRRAFERFSNAIYITRHRFGKNGIEAYIEKYKE